MNFQADELTQQVAQTARDFALQHIKPHVMTWDESQEFPLQVFKEMGKLGLMGVLVPEKYGGAGLGYFEYVAIIQEIAKVCGSVGLSLAAHNSLCTGHILSFGNEEQKSKYLPKLATAEWIVRRFGTGAAHVRPARATHRRSRFVRRTPMPAVALGLCRGIGAAVRECAD